MNRKLPLILQQLLPAVLALLLVNWCANALKGDAFVPGSTFLFYLDPLLAALGLVCPAFIKSLLPFLLLPWAVWWIASTSKPFWQRVTWAKKTAILAFAMLLSILVDGLKGELFSESSSGSFLGWLNGSLHAMNLDDHLAGMKLAMLVAALTWLAWFLRREIVNPLPIHILVPQGAANPHRCLITVISPNGANWSPGAPPIPPGGRAGFALLAGGVSINGSPIELPHPDPTRWEDARKNIETLDAHMATRGLWKWMMLLRAIYPHLDKDTLKQIVLLGSPGEKGSFRDREDARSLIQRVVGSTVKVIIYPDAVEFEVFEAFHAVLDQQITELRAKRFPGRDDIMIDTSAGQKTASIAAAMFTLHDDASFQYVDTNGSIAAGTNEIAYQLRYHDASVI
ncbi:MAG: hypothetical protein PHS32_04740 [Rhodoferax sp.]|uniref:hypothetical protein n=1 Tax=Rhodoferax sp. TaxID=50421 RepID=UPI00262DB981|nr:hypothetical protein [Rhodoferax sp.]MDD5333034.1 hypothetical protein [Rhodoferax sp.]